MNKNNDAFSYQIGGSLNSHSSSYVEREADHEFAEALKQGQFCYVLNSRQMGKSSLRVRAMSRLQAEGTVCIFVDLTGIGTQNLTAEKWYAGIVLSLVHDCQLEFNWRDWWREKRDLLSPVQRLGLFIEGILLTRISANIVIFVDEIDRVLSQDFSLDDFFALIHSCYQKRQANANYHRLTFALLGVAAPKDLIRNKIQSPFETGRSIRLEGFTLKEASGLTLGLSNVVNPQQTLAEILDWTGGQPFLTQKICKLVAETENKSQANFLAKIIDRYIVKDWEIQDEPEHLRTIRDRLCYRDSSKTIRLLGLYQDILQKKNISFTNDAAQIDLRLSGLVVEKKGFLKVSNPIYAQIFDQTWCDTQLAQLRPYARTITAWINSQSCDDNHLLCGKELQNALTWSLGKSLADIDYQFLVASQEIAKQHAKDTLIVVESASKLLAAARKEAGQKVIKQCLNRQWLVKIGLGITGFVLLLRCTGILQTWEWNLLDSFFRWQISNTIEPRIVVVTIDERDLKTLRQFPISDRILAKAIKRIEQHRPKAIALDIYRDFSVPSKSQDLEQLLNSTSNLYVVEKVIGESILPPSNIDRNQVGFADQVVDSDGTIRRALLSIDGKDNQSRYSLGTKLALHYLQDRQIKFKPLSHDRYQLGKAIFHRFTANSGGYVGADAGGYQTLLNYWGTESNFRQYSLTEVLNDQLTTENIRDHLVFIGSTAESIDHTFSTPYSQNWFHSPSEIYGVFIHANITSQIINAALNDRPLLYTYNKFLESLWILFWGCIGVILLWYRRTYKKMFSILIPTSTILIITCYLAFKSGWWLPLVPALLTLIVTVITAMIVRNKQRDRLKFKYTLELLLAEYQTSPIAGRIALEYFKQSESKANSYLVAKQITQLPLDN